MKFILVLVFVSFLNACASSPDMNNDPSGGGLWGGVTGLWRGDYEARDQQRKESIDRLNQVKDITSQEGNTLDQQKSNKAIELSAISNELDTLNADIGGLSLKNLAAKRTSKANESKIRQISIKKKELQREIDKIRNSIDNQQIDVKEAEVRRDKLRQEYKLLVDLLNKL